MLARRHLCARTMIAFGPVPSRRLGRSLGINHIPPKVCSYACVYCQLGRTIQMQVARATFHSPWEILQAVQGKVASAREAGEPIDYLTFVPDGEPTLDSSLGREIDLLRPLGTRIAVISNASLIWQKEVREDLMQADWVSLKVDSTRASVWRRVDRPHGALRLEAILEGMLAFAETYRGTLVTETMLVDGLNDGEAHVAELAEFLASLGPARAYLSVPTRPPAEPWVRAPSEYSITRAYRQLQARVSAVECLIGYEGNEFACTGDVEADLLGIAAVHPMRADAVDEFLARAGSDWATVERLLATDQLVEHVFEGQTFYLRKLPGSHVPASDTEPCTPTGQAER
jgi:wyosine [tRNA(Phe)-imidazoG37] synthetase (radical SAM superfamily)